jgi:predicted transcriptional regulator
MNNTETNSPIATVRNMLTGRTNQQLSEMLTLLADNENTTESRIVEAAICEVIIDRKPEFTDILDAWSEDYTSQVTMRELAINFLND